MSFVLKLFLSLAFGALLFTPFIANAMNYGYKTEKNMEIIKKSNQCPDSQRDSSGKCPPSARSTSRYFSGGGFNSGK